MQEVDPGSYQHRLIEREVSFPHQGGNVQALTSSQTICHKLVEAASTFETQPVIRAAVIYEGVSRFGERSLLFASWTDGSSTLGGSNDLQWVFHMYR